MELATEDSEFEPGPLALECACVTVVYCFSVMAHHSKMEILIHFKSIFIQMWLMRESTMGVKDSFFHKFCVYVMDKLQDRG